MSYGNRWDQTKSAERHGTDGFGQASDGTGTLNHLAKYNANGSVTDSTLLASDVVTSPGGGEALTVTGYGSWYGQVPRGAVDGVNTVFHLDYRLVNPFAILHLNGVGQLPAVQGDPSNPVATMAVPGSEFSITDWTLTVANAPRPGEKFYIYYFRKDPMAAVSSATLSVWTSFTAPDGISRGAVQVNYVAPGGVAQLVVRDDALWSLRQNTYSIPSPPATLAGFAGAQVGMFIDGTLTAESANSINIYDCYLSLVLTDASVFTLRPIGWSFTSGSDGSLNSWVASTGYTLGIQVMDSNGNIQQCAVAGTSGTTSPVWAVSGNTIEGGVTWSYVGPASSQTSTTGQITNPTLAYDADTTTPTTFATFTRSHYSGLSDGGTFILFF